MASLATFKKDALLYLLGMAAGMFIFAEAAPFLEDFMYSGFLGESITLSEFFDLPAWIVVAAISCIAIVGFIGAEWLERWFGKVR